MSEYRVEKLRHTLSVLLRNGEWLEGDVFLRPVSKHRSRPEEPADLLNDEEPFFALVRDDHAVLVAKANVVRAETSSRGEDDIEAEAVGASLGVTVEITLADGSLCHGSVFLESRTDRPRLLDFLNTYRSRFLVVVDATHVVLLNTQTIAHVREVA